MSIYDTVKTLGRIHKDEWGWLESHPTFIKAQKEGKSIYLTDPNGGHTEYITFGTITGKVPIQGDDIAEYVDAEGLTAYFKINVLESGEMTEEEFEVKYPSAVYTGSGKLVHLAA